MKRASTETQVNQPKTRKPKEDKPKAHEAGNGKKPSDEVCQTKKALCAMLGVSMPTLREYSRTPGAPKEFPFVVAQWKSFLFAQGSKAGLDQEGRLKDLRIEREERENEMQKIEYKRLVGRLIPIEAIEPLFANLLQAVKQLADRESPEVRERLYAGILAIDDVAMAKQAMKGVR